ncbi:MAG: non-heme iron oxygenase ferredoxin subunit [Brachybacterium sp.]|nr:non-heme iron oxygenase ferredoxin subunit [Brachybacterium sp.]
MSDAFVTVASLADLAPGEVRGIEVDGTWIALARASDGGVHALADQCSHEDVPLSDGDVEDSTLECWKHGSQFDLATGRPRQLPAVLPVPVYPVRVDETTGDIGVDISAPSTA